MTPQTTDMLPVKSSPAPGAAKPATRQYSSRFTGVAWDKHNLCWVVHISANRKQRHLGCFRDEVAAAKVYDDAARQAFGEFATLNFPTDAERQRAAKWYDRDAACRFFGVTRHVFKTWVRQGKIIGGRLVPSSTGGGKRRVFTLEDLERIKEEMFGEDKLYKDGKSGVYHVPSGLVTRREACDMFGVSIMTWWHWEREGRITCGTRVPGGPKLYKIDDIKPLLEPFGRLPYPDPERPGCYRVRLYGYDIHRSEAIIDAESLPLIEGGTCHWSETGVGGVVAFSSAQGEHDLLRRVIMGVTSTKMHVGHRNGDALDCRRENLIVRTVTQRSRSARKMKKINGRPPTSRYKGVFWDTWAGKWRARISVGEKNHSLGRFYDEIDAAECYDIAARRYFGKHAWLNFPGEGERGFADATAAALAPGSDDQSLKLAA